MHTVPSILNDWISSKNFNSAEAAVLFSTVLNNQKLIVIDDASALRCWFLGFLVSLSLLPHAGLSNDVTYLNRENKMLKYVKPAKKMAENHLSLKAVIVALPDSTLSDNADFPNNDWKLIASRLTHSKQEASSFEVDILTIHVTNYINDSNVGYKVSCTTSTISGSLSNNNEDTSVIDKNIIYIDHIVNSACCENLFNMTHEYIKKFSQIYLTRKAQFDIDSVPNAILYSLMATLDTFYTSLCNLSITVRLSLYDKVQYILVESKDKHTNSEPFYYSLVMGQNEVGQLDDGRVIFDKLDKPLQFPIINELECKSAECGWTSTANDHIADDSLLKVLLDFTETEIENVARRTKLLHFMREKLQDYDEQTFNAEKFITILMTKLVVNKEFLDVKVGLYNYKVDNINDLIKSVVIRFDQYKILVINLHNSDIYSKVSNIVPNMRRKNSTYNDVLTYQVINFGIENFVKSMNPSQWIVFQGEFVAGIYVAIQKYPKIALTVKAGSRITPIDTEVRSDRELMDEMLIDPIFVIKNILSTVIQFLNSQKGYVAYAGFTNVILKNFFSEYFTVTSLGSMYEMSNNRKQFVINVIDPQNNISYEECKTRYKSYASAMIIRLPYMEYSFDISMNIRVNSFCMISLNGSVRASVSDSPTTIKNFKPLPLVLYYQSKDVNSTHDEDFTHLSMVQKTSESETIDNILDQPRKKRFTFAGNLNLNTPALKELQTKVNKIQKLLLYTYLGDNVKQLIKGKAIIGRINRVEWLDIEALPIEPSISSESMVAKIGDSISDGYPIIRPSMSVDTLFYLNLDYMSWRRPFFREETKISGDISDYKALFDKSRVRLYRQLINVLDSSPQFDIVVQSGYEIYLDCYDASLPSIQQKDKSWRTVLQDYFPELTIFNNMKLGPLPLNSLRCFAQHEPVHDSDIFLEQMINKINVQSMPGWRDRYGDDPTLGRGKVVVKFDDPTVISVAKSGDINRALILAGKGTDEVVGFKNRRNTIYTESGSKLLIGGAKDDEFVLCSDSQYIRGAIFGDEGTNSLILLGYRTEISPLILKLYNVSLELSFQNIEHSTLIVDSIQKIIGRNRATEILEAPCDLKEIDLRSSYNHYNPDTIIFMEHCVYDVTIQFWMHTKTTHYNSKGIFNYLLSENQLEIDFSGTSPGSIHKIFVQESIFDIRFTVHARNHSSGQYYMDVNYRRFRPKIASIYSGNKNMLIVVKECSVAVKSNMIVVETVHPVVSDSTLIRPPSVNQVYQILDTNWEYVDFKVVQSEAASSGFDINNIRIDCEYKLTNNMQNEYEIILQATTPFIEHIQIHTTPPVQSQIKSNILVHADNAMYMKAVTFEQVENDVKMSINHGYAPSITIQDGVANLHQLRLFYNKTYEILTQHQNGYIFATMELISVKNVDILIIDQEYAQYYAKKIHISATELTNDQMFSYRKGQDGIDVYYCPRKPNVSCRPLFVIKRCFKGNEDIFEKVPLEFIDSFLGLSI